MGLITRFKRYFDLDDDPSVPESEATQTEMSPRRGKQNVVSLQSVHQQSQLILMEPRHFDEAQKIADQLKNHRAVVMNFQRTSHEEASRIIDFLSGTVYAIDGDFQKLGPRTFICTPKNMDVSGAISEMVDRID